MLRKYVFESGRSDVDEWYETLPRGDRGHVRTKLDYLRQDRERWKDQNRFKSINSGTGKGLGEIILRIDGKQIRLIGYFGPYSGSYTVLTVEVKKSRTLAPRIWKKAQDRKRRVEENKELSHEWEI